MRAIFILLLLANLLLLGWIMSDQGATGGRPDVVATPGVDTIVLLSEVESNAGQLADPPAEADDPAQLAAVDVQQPGEAAAPAVPAAASQPAAGRADEKVAATQSEPRPAVEVAASPVAAKAVDSCHTVGPFRDLGKLRGIIKAVRDKVVEASFRSREEVEQTLFWVFLKPEADMDSARATTRMLRQKRVKDSYIIADGDKQFGISLGHFKEKPRAYTLRDRITRLGFKPVVEPVFRTYTIFWLDYRLAAGQDNSGMLEGLKLGDAINQFDRSCS